MISERFEGPWVPVGKLMKSTFEPNKFHVISTSQSGFMIESLKTAQNVKSLPEDLSCSTSHAKLYHSKMFHGACHTCLEILSSLVSHPTNGLSFRLPSREKWSFYWRLRRSPGDALELKTISWMIHLLAFHLPTWSFSSYLSRGVVPSINIPYVFSEKNFWSFDKPIWYSSWFADECLTPLFLRVLLGLVRQISLRSPNSCSMVASSVAPFCVD